jgi:hypothetical protein
MDVRALARERSVIANADETCAMRNAKERAETAARNWSRHAERKARYWWARDAERQARYAKEDAERKARYAKEDARVRTCAVLAIVPSVCVLVARAVHRAIAALT